MKSQKSNPPKSYWMSVWMQFRRHRLGSTAFYVVILYCLVGIFAPFLASSKPFFVYYDGSWFFPLFRYLFYTGFYTKRLDIFFNLLIFTFPLSLICYFLLERIPRLRFWSISLILAGQLILFGYFSFITPRDPAADTTLTQKRQAAIKKEMANGEYLPSWKFDLKYMSPYAKLNLILRYQQRKIQNERLEKYWPKEKGSMPTLWQLDRDNERNELEQQKIILKEYQDQQSSSQYKHAQAKIAYIQDRQQWLEEQSSQLKYELMPLLRSFHWEDDAAGSQSLNQHVPWWELTRTNRKDLVAALIFGVRISLVVGIMAVGLAVIIGVPVGAFAGFYGGTYDIAVSRLLEIWESMPTFFMLLLVVAITQSKSIFIVIGVIGIFGWTGFSRYIRGEFFKQRNLPYVEACRALGFRDRYIIYSHILPNALPPVLTLLPFAIMGAITSEAGLSFLGLGEEGSSSWGVLMDEGRTAFPGESYLLWPPAILLTILLVAIALVGDALRDSLDPKMQR